MPDNKRKDSKIDYIPTGTMFDGYCYDCHNEMQVYANGLFYLCKKCMTGWLMDENGNHRNIGVLTDKG